MARQQYIRTELNDFYIDLVFYNFLLKCFVLIDLKTSQLTHQDIGRMDMYVRMYDELRKDPEDNPTLGSCCVPKRIAMSRIIRCSMAVSGCLLPNV